MCEPGTAVIATGQVNDVRLYRDLIASGIQDYLLKPLNPDAVRRILARRVAMAGLEADGIERLSAHALRVGFITEAYQRGVRDEDIMRHTRHRDLRTMRGYVRRAGLLSDSPAAALDL